MNRPAARFGSVRLIVALIVGCIVGCPVAQLAPTAAAASAGLVAGQQTPPALIGALRQGGRVLLLRHAATDPAQKDSDLKHLENCAMQRNLSEAGREQSLTIGRELRRLGIPVGVVLASPYCRTLETARLAFGEAEASADLVSQSVDDPPGGRERLTAALHTLLAQPPAPGTNTVLVTHFLNINDATLLDVEEGEAIVVLPDGLGGYTIEGQVKAAEWSLFPTPEEAVDGEPAASYD